MGIFDKIKEKINENINPNHQKAYERFSESTKKEMLESQKLADSINLYSLKLDDLGEHTVSYGGDDIVFKEGVVHEDKIGKYIIIKGEKCREYQPGISGFVYKDIRSKYSPNERLKVGFCDKGIFKKSVIIDSSFGAKSLDMIPSDVSKQLGGPFYLQENSKTSKKGPLHDIKWKDIFSVEYTITLKKEEEEIRFKDGIIKKDGSKNSLVINGTTFKKYTPGCSGFVYKEFFDSREGIGEGNCLLLAEYKDGKMVGEGVIVTSTKRTYHITNGN